MLEKLRWEYEQLSDAKLDRDGKVHTAINCAWTAWHLHEWVWKGLKRRPDLKVRYAKEAGWRRRSSTRTNSAHGWLRHSQTWTSVGL